MVILGVDGGGSTLKTGLYDPKGGPLDGIIGNRMDVPSRANEGPEATVSAILQSIPLLCERCGIDPSLVKCAGVCVPTPVTAAGQVLYATNIHPSWKGADVRGLLSRALRMPVMVLNDGDAAVYREYLVRRARGETNSENLLGFVTGTGLGGGFIYNGKIFRTNKPCLEVGHVLTDTIFDAPKCGCGDSGCVEAHSSLVGLGGMLRSLDREEWPASLRELDPAEARFQLRKLAQADKPEQATLNIWREYSVHLGRAVKSAVQLLGPDLVVISGGVMEREEGVSDFGFQRSLDRIMATVRSELMRTRMEHVNKLRVEWAIDTCVDAACYGAAAAAIDVLNPQ